jgi:ABC-type multidrug transport system ATPase subunit
VEGSLQINDLKKKSAFLPRQGGYPADFTGNEQFEYFSGLFPYFSWEKAEELIHRFQLPLYQKLEEITDMEARLILLMGILSANVDIILLEEPFYTMTGKISSELEELFKEEVEKGRAVLFTLRDKNREVVNFPTTYLMTAKGIVPQEKKDDDQASDGNEEKKTIHKLPVWQEDKEKAILIDHKNIKWISTYKGESTLHTTRGDYKVKLLLRELQDRLTSPPFLRCHRSYIVNLEYIEEVITWFNGTYNLKIGDKEIPVSRSNASDLEDMLGM